MKTLEFAIKYSVSKAKDTYNYNVLTIVGEGMKARCMGGGYDMLGTCLATIIQKVYPHFFDGTVEYAEREKLMKEFYGFTIRGDGSAYLQGACGVECMEKFLEGVIGGTIVWEYARDREGYATHRNGLRLTVGPNYKELTHA